jgi:hypothetical protein
LSHNSRRPRQERRRHHPHAALALDRLDQDRRGFRTDGRFDRLEVAERNLVEARHHRAEPFQVFFLAAGGEGRERTPVEGAFERNDAVTLGPGAYELVFARDLDRALHRLGTGIAEEDEVGEGGGT